jgi:pimeloyl-ACP methyl ester carboxylesterase
VGLGDSTSGNPEDFSSPGQGRVFQAARSALGISSYSIIGNNSGGWIARELALREPECVAHLVLTNTEIPHRRPPWVEFYQWIAKLPGSRMIFQKLLASRSWRDSSMGFGGCFQNPGLLEGEFRQAFLAPLLASKERLARALQFLIAMNFKRIDEFKELHRKLTMPVSFVWGASDPTFPESQAREMAKQFPNTVRFTTIRDGKLFMHEEYPERVSEAVITSLEAPA